MSWNPTQQIINLAPILDNLLGYIADNQGDAHKFANDDDAMDDYTIYPNATGRLATKFPQLLVLRHGHAGESAETENGDVLVITWRLLFEGAVSGRDTDELVVTARRYAYALESMLANIPTASLSTDISHAFLANYSTEFDQIGQGGKSASSWVQVWQTACEFKLISAAF